MATSSLIRIFKTTIQRVTCEIQSLNSNAVFILINDSGKYVGVWLGEKSSRIDKAVTETKVIPELIKMLKLNFSSTTVPYLLEGTVDVSDVDLIRLIKEIGGNMDKYLKLKDERKNSLANNISSLSMLEMDENKIFTLNEISTTKLNEKGSLSKLSFQNPTPTTLAVVIVGTEIDLWVGNEIKQDDRNNAVTFLKNKFLSQIQIVRQGFESFIFKEQFTPDTPFVAHSNGSFPGKLGKCPSARASIRSIDGETRRMVSDDFGTLRMIKAESGDSSREGMGLKLLDDKTVILKVFVVSGPSRTLAEVPAHQSYLLSSRGAYAIVVAFKGRTKVICYLWQGVACPTTSRAALAAQATTLINSMADLKCQGAEQIMIDQGREPLILLRLFQKFSAGILCVTSGSDPTEAVSFSGVSLLGGSASGVYHLRVSDCQLGDDSVEGPVAVQVPDSCLTVPPLTAIVTIIVDQGSNKGKKGCVLVKTTVGINASPTVCAAVNKLTAQAKSIVPYEDATSAIDLKAALVPTSGSRYNAKLLLRPRRMFMVSSVRRDVGAMFVEEVGAGGTFIQEDLIASAHECMLLDTGRVSEDGLGKVLLWIGPDCGYRAIALGIRVTRQYLRSLDRGAIDIDDALINASISVVLSGMEPESFVSCFRTWDANLQRVSTKTINFSLTDLPDSEMGDALLDDNGEVVLERKRMSYRETTTYKHATRASDGPSSSSPEGGGISALQRHQTSLSAASSRAKSARFLELVGETGGGASAISAVEKTSPPLSTTSTTRTDGSELSPVLSPDLSDKDFGSGPIPPKSIKQGGCGCLIA